MCSGGRRCLSTGRERLEPRHARRRNSNERHLRRASMTVEVVGYDSLKAHPRNYRRHPEDQLQHIVASIREHGVYRKVVVARDGTILAGHGVVQAARKAGLKEIPVVRLDVAPDDRRALKLMAADNEVSKLAEVDDRALTELLKNVMGADGAGLLGTGFDRMSVAALAYTTSPASELNDMRDLAEWAGMPGYDEWTAPISLVITFQTEAERLEFVEQAGLTIDKKLRRMWGTRWPFTPREKLAKVRFEAST